MNTDTGELRRRAEVGDRSALGRLVGLQLGPLMRWAHRRLPAWVRTAADTADVVHDAVLHTLRRIGRVELQHSGALQSYLRRAVINRINDEFRKVGRRGVAEPLSEELPAPNRSPLDDVAYAQLESTYKRALAALSDRDRVLVVGHIEMEYSLDQLAHVDGRGKDATRVALRRALVRLAAVMADLQRSAVE